MLFNSFNFLLLAAVTLAIYYAPLAASFQIPVLIGASLIFYGSSQPSLLLLLLLSLAINITASHLVVVGDLQRRRTYATLGVVFNLLVLIFFKYGALLIATLPFEMGAVGSFIVAIPLPLGISFFTFHGITLLVDTFRSHGASAASSNKNDSFSQRALKVGLYFLFFPQLVAGPITKSRNFIPQIRPKLLSDVNWEYAFRNIVAGYFLKMVVADNLAQHTFWISYPYFLSRSSLDLVILLAGYSMQIFADFAGYSLIAVGIAALFGYMLPQNFNSPYISQSFSEFWKRWHISLSSFLKEYLYVPLGGNRMGTLRTYLNLFTVMLLGGMWHGAAWSFMVWGGAHGLALGLERAVGDRLRLPDYAIVKILKVVFVFSYVSLAWLLFKLTNIGNVIDYIGAILGNSQLNANLNTFLFVCLYSTPVLVYHLIRRFRKNLSIVDRPAMAAFLYGLMLFLIITNSGEPQSFVYFQF